MTNHVHVVAIPEREGSLWRTFHRCHGCYATEFNLKYRCSGHVWQARPYSCALDDAHLWAAIRYVELNPVRAGMVYRAEQYRWSSAPAHCGLVEAPLLDTVWRSPAEIQDWKRWLAFENADDINQRIRQRTHTGRPCGDGAFVRLAEQLTGRCLFPKKPGPKPKTELETQAMLWRTDEIGS